MPADILTFDTSRRRLHRKDATGAAGEILLFSGVRYERDGYTAETPALFPDDQGDVTDENLHPANQV